MKKIMLMAVLIAGTCFTYAQNQSDYELVKSDNKDEVIYKGPCTFEDIGQVKAFDLAKKAAQYKPDLQKTAALASRLADYQLVIFLGTWCEDSHKLIPELYRVLQETSYPLDDLQLYALDRKKKGKNGEEKQYHITNVPTIIVLKEGKELGRITETAEQNVESDLLKIVQKE